MSWPIEYQGSDDSDIELVAAPPSATAKARRVNSSYNSATVNKSDNEIDHGDFFAGLGAPAGPSSSSVSAAMDLPPPLLSRQSIPQAGSSREGSTSRQQQPPNSDVIEIGSDDDEDEDEDDAMAGPSTSNNLRKTHSAPSAVYTNGNNRSKQKPSNGLFEAMSSSSDEDNDSDGDVLPDIRSISHFGNALKRSNSDMTGVSTLNKGKYRALSPVAGSSSPPRAGNNVSSRDQRKHLPSDLDSSGDEAKRPRKKRQPKNTGVADQSSATKVKPPTKKQLQDQERAAKKAQKELEKEEKAAQEAIDKERKLIDRNANQQGDRAAHCVEIHLEISQPLLEDTYFRNHVWHKLHARLGTVPIKHTALGEGRIPKPGCYNKLIYWKRDVTKDWNAKQKRWVARSPEHHTMEEEKTILMFLGPEEIEEAVAAHKFFGAEDHGETLLEMVANVRKVHGKDYQVILLVQNLSLKRKAKASADNAEWMGEAGATAASKVAAKRRKANKWDERITMEDIEQELVRLEVIAGCSVQKNETVDQAVDWISELTKDVAHRPYKIIERVREMYLNIDGRIESTDRGDLHKTYVNQLACITGVTEASARAIAATYPTWRRLHQAYKGAAVPKYALEGIRILNRKDGAATEKMVGKALSEKIYIFLTSKTPHLLLTGDIKTVRGRA